MQHISECGLPGEVSDLNSALTCFLGSPGTEVTLHPGESCVFMQHISVYGLLGEVYYPYDLNSAWEDVLGTTQYACDWVTHKGQKPFFSPGLTLYPRAEQPESTPKRGGLERLPVTNRLERLPVTDTTRQTNDPPHRTDSPTHPTPPYHSLTCFYVTTNLYAYPEPGDPIHYHRIDVEGRTNIHQPQWGDTPYRRTGGQSSVTSYTPPNTYPSTHLRTDSTRLPQNDVGTIRHRPNAPLNGKRTPSLRKQDNLNTQRQFSNSYQQPQWPLPEPLGKMSLQPAPSVSMSRGSQRSNQPVAPTPREPSKIIFVPPPTPDQTSAAFFGNDSYVSRENAARKAEADRLNSLCIGKERAAYVQDPTYLDRVAVATAVEHLVVSTGKSIHPDNSQEHNNIQPTNKTNHTRTGRNGIPHQLSVENTTGDLTLHKLRKIIITRIPFGDPPPGCNGKARNSPDFYKTLEKAQGAV